MCLSTGSGPTVGATPVSGAENRLGRLSPRVVAGLRSAMRETDVVLANGSATLRYSIAATRGSLDRPALAYSSIGEPTYWAKTKGRQRALASLLKRVDRVGAVSKETRRQLVDQLGLDADVVDYTPTGLASFGEPTELNGGHLRLLWVGSLSSEKQPILTIDVMRRVEERVSLTVVGDGPLHRELSAAAKADPRVDVVGAVTDISREVKRSDLLIQTSASEGLPGVILEAAAQGIPAVAFDVGGTRELVIHGVTGFLIPPGDVSAMAQAIGSLERDRERLKSMGQAALEHVRANFELSTAIDRYEALLEAAIADRRK